MQFVTSGLLILHISQVFVKSMMFDIHKPLYIQRLTVGISSQDGMLFGRLGRRTRNFLDRLKSGADSDAGR